MINKKKINKRCLTIVLIGVLFVLFCGIVVAINISGRKLEKYSDITFVNPNQALIFWKSKDETLGYIKYGTKKFGKKETVLQTSSEPGVIHVVFLEDIPLEGVYLRKFNESNSILFFEPLIYIKYEGESNE